jgi:TolB protein
MNVGVALLSASLAVALTACGPGANAPRIAPTITIAPRPTRDARATATPAATPTPAASATAQPAALVSPDTASLAPCADVKPALNPVKAKLGGDGRAMLLTPAGNVVLSALDGARTDVTTDGFIDQQAEKMRVYQFPTASADGKSLALVRLDIADGASSQTLEVFETRANPKRTELFSTGDFNIPYLDWSPNGQTIAFLTISPSGGAIRAVSSGGGEVASVEQGQPTYWHWRSDSSGLLTHLGGSAAEGGDARVSLVAMRGAAPVSVDRLVEPPGRFQSPHWSPDNTHMLYVRAGTPDTLVLADAAGAPVCVVSTVDAGAYFAWSPTGTRVALLDSASPLQAQGTVRVFDLQTGTDVVIQERALAFFWSPDGERLAAYSITRAAQPTLLGATGGMKLSDRATQSGGALLAIDIVAVDGARRVNVANTIPTGAFLQYFNFFDQYSRAVTPWSPNGKHVAFAGAASPDAPPLAGIATLSPDGSSVTLKNLGDGSLAFFIAN